MQCYQVFFVVLSACIEMTSVQLKRVSIRIWGANASVIVSSPAMVSLGIEQKLQSS